MENEDKVALDAYKESGVELPPETEVKTEVTTVTEPEGDEPTPETAKPDEKVTEPKPDEKLKDGESKADVEPLQTEPKEQKKRSIYHDLKDTRNDLKSEREAREKAERELELLKTQLAEKPDSKTTDDLDAFATEIGADPQALKKMKDFFLKDVPASTISPELQTKLEQFEEWQKNNSEAIESQKFETEFQSAIPELKKIFPEASQEDILAMKAEIDKLAHSNEFHDKEIDYIAFKNQAKLTSFITPRKRGLESKGRVDATNIPNTFDPNADITKMSPKEAEAWEKSYNQLMKNSELTTDSIGRRVML